MMLPLALSDEQVFARRKQHWRLIDALKAKPPPRFHSLVLTGIRIPKPVTAARAAADGSIREAHR